MIIPEKQSVAVIGGGVAGIVAAYLASQKHSVTIFESTDYLGGHTNTITLNDGPDAGAAIDTGFIVMNDQTYPLLHQFLSRLGVPVRFADMSFSYYCETTGLTYGSRDFNHLFCQRKNLLRPRFYQMLLGITRFWREAEQALRSGELRHLSLGDALKKFKIPHSTIRDYILPMAGAIWSTPAEEMLSSSAHSIIHFCKNHGLLGLKNQPRWQTVVGGSHSYVRAFQQQFAGTIQIRKRVQSVRRDDHGATLTFVDSEPERFDYCIVALHADQVLKLLENPTSKEQQLFSPWSYKTNHTVLHSDVRHLPPLKRAWASWNYRREQGRKDATTVPITYYMNMLQGLALNQEYCVTLNPEREIFVKSIVKEISYTHPVFSVDAFATQEALNQHRGEERTFFVGSYHGFGFHEDAVRSGVRVGQLLGGEL
jgi:predicted NAD/FAD-binding protein